MAGIIRHNCGLVVAHTLHDAYSFIKSLQHRGREATGIAAIGKGRIDVVKWIGPVNRISNKTLHKFFNAGEYHTFFAHVRYATRGRKDQILNDAHPHTIGGVRHDYGSHVHIRDCDMAIIHNGQVDVELLEKEGADLKALRTGCDTEALLLAFKQGKMDEKALVNLFKGAYTLAIADKNKDHVLVIRDRLGMKPGVIGWKDGNYVVASEDVAFIECGAEQEKELRPGSTYKLFPDGSYASEKHAEPKPRHCFFEWNYLASRKSTLSEVPVKKLREKLGVMLAKEHKPEDADYVTFLPQSPEDAAKAYSEESRIRFRTVFYKLRDERSFQGSTTTERKNSINENLYLRPLILKELKGKTLVVIDDSIVRGNNSRHAINMLFDAGVKKIYFLSYTPPIGVIGEDGKPRGCTWGVDMPPDDSFIARGRSENEIARELGQDKPKSAKLEVKYLTTESMMKVYESLKMPRNNLCTYCIGGKHPFR
ncbi:hypothetical protein JW826_01170 [Candidatus Woesearchaeota archaeon]|nr:hypothetical protein [Candidatus Woesearchaeota archaeon]